MDVNTLIIGRKGTSRFAAVANTASQKFNLHFYLYFMMRLIVPYLSKEVYKVVEGTRTEMGGGKDLAEDHNVVVIASIGLVEVKNSHSTRE